jgi:hypothetical protein
MWRRIYQCHLFSPLLLAQALYEVWRAAKQRLERLRIAKRSLGPAPIPRPQPQARAQVCMQPINAFP